MKQEQTGTKPEQKSLDQNCETAMSLLSGYKKKTGAERTKTAKEECKRRIQNGIRQVAN